jgi:hypothetical protein
VTWSDLVLFFFLSLEVKKKGPRGGSIRCFKDTDHSLIASIFIGLEGTAKESIISGPVSEEYNLLLLLLTSKS